MSWLVKNLWDVGGLCANEDYTPGWIGQRSRSVTIKTYPDPNARIQPTATFCFTGICRFQSVTTGMMTSTPSVLMLRIACASAMLFRQVVVPSRSGLHGTARMMVKTSV